MACILLTEEDLRCAICLDVFTDPIRTPCGHNYCRACVTRWDTNEVSRCLLCATVFDQRPEVSADALVSEMVHWFRSHKWQEEYEEKTEAGIQQMIQERRVKIQEVKDLISCVERSQAELLGAIEEKKKTTKKRAEGFIKDLKREMTQLEDRISELKQHSQTEDCLHLLQNFTSINTPPPTKDWTKKVNVLQSSYVDTVRTAVARLEKTLSEEMEKKLGDAELRRIQQYAVDVTLDPDTAHPYLILSDDGKQVSHGDSWENVPDNRERFSTVVGVLGKQSCSSGRFYYEVQVEGKTKWDLGLARESINRKGNVYLHPRNGYWTIGFSGNEYWANANPAVLLPVREEVQKVGVFVDCDKGLVSFYDVETRVHLHSFTGCSFTERLYPFFTPCFNRNGRNSAPLIISPVNMDVGLGGYGDQPSKRRKT